MTKENELVMLVIRLESEFYAKDSNSPATWLWFGQEVCRISNGLFTIIHIYRWCTYVCCVECMLLLIITLISWRLLPFSASVSCDSQLVRLWHRNWIKGATLHQQKKWKPPQHNNTKEPKEPSTRHINIDFKIAHILHNFMSISCTPLDVIRFTLSAKRALNI